MKFCSANGFSLDNAKILLSCKGLTVMLTLTQIIPCLTLSQMTNFRIFQTERVFRRRFLI